MLTHLGRSITMTQSESADTHRLPHLSVSKARGGSIVRHSTYRQLSRGVHEICWTVMSEYAGPECQLRKGGRSALIHICLLVFE